MSVDPNKRMSELEHRVLTFLKRNFPQIRMHGGNATIEEIDPESGEVSVRLGGACSGCGISPMTTQAIKNRLPDAIPEIETVDVETGEPEEEDQGSGTTPSFPGDRTSDDESSSPF